MTHDDIQFRQLLDEARLGDEASITGLFELTYPMVRPIVHRSLERDLRRGRPWLIARFSTGDVVQEVCRSVLTDLDAFRGDTRADFEAFLALVTRNRIIDAIRHHEAERRDGRRGGRELAPDDADERAETPDAQAASREFQARFAEAVDELPEREQLLVRARLEGEHSFEELARMLGYSSTSKAQRVFADVRARLSVRISRSMEGQA